MSNGYILWRGASLLDDAPIIVVATGFDIPSKNEKTGQMIQTWILREDIAPGEALRTCEDASICGDCKHRGRTCYVMVHWGVSQVWKAARRGKYHAIDRRQLGKVGRDQAIRLGTYGDPAAVPSWVWRRLIEHARHHTGYTHQWRTATHLGDICMASVDTPAEREEAKAMGWRTFRVRTSHDPVLEREVICPASAEAGRKTTCEECRACGGLSSKAKADIVIRVHGSPKRARAFENGDLFNAGF